MSCEAGPTWEATETTGAVTALSTELVGTAEFSCGLFAAAATAAAAAAAADPAAVGIV